jgi:hypothetical protein
MKIEATPYFLRSFERLVKKYPSMKSDINELSDSLLLNPAQGIPLGRNAFKIRMAITSKGKGKSGGAKVITYVKINNETIFLVDIHDKSEKENISDEDLKAFIDEINNDILILPEIFICGSQETKKYFLS